MQQAKFSGLFAALSAEHRMNFIANNLANVNTASYKQDKLAFKDTMIQFAHDQIREPIATVRSKPLFPEPNNAARVRIAVSNTDFAQGSMQFTGNPLDFAITGENGFFRIQSPQGNYLTRNGSFVLDATGQLVTKQGWPVLGDGGPITIPEGTKKISITPDGRIFADDAEVGTIQFVSLDDVKKLEKVGANLYRPKEGLEIIEGNANETGAIINQGFLESSNVNVVEEMVKMIEVNRQFDAYQKVMQTSDSLDREAYSKVGRTSR